MYVSGFSCTPIGSISVIDINLNVILLNLSFPWSCVLQTATHNFKWISNAYIFVQFESQYLLIAQILI